GFYAHSLDEERPVEDFHADQLVEIVDITDQVESRTAGLSGINLTEARADALEAITDEIQEERGGEDAGWIVEPVTLYNGAVFSAYVFRRYENAKLVMAPELQIGFFGGDPDNFTYPRYNLDFSFFRLYDDDGSPLRTDAYFQWSPEGVSEDDVVFIIGNPGSTSRLQTVAQLEFRRDIGDAYVLDFIRDRVDVLRGFIDAYPEVAEERDLRNSLFELLNEEKARVGQLRGLRDPVILARRKAAQEELLDSLATKPELKDRFGGMFDDMAEIQEQERELAPGFGAFLGLSSAELASPTLHRALVAFQVLNVQSRGGPSETIADLLEELRGVADTPAELDEGLIEARIGDFIEYYGEDSWVQNILEGRTPEGAA
ncbi:MAG TPA: S46 family peptidase, partial [Longimicrobiales bacterium]|nr:S46 family peptidase [Longimicrobiales bacterium]